MEHYDFFIHATAASLAFPPIFFPPDNPTVAIIAPSGEVIAPYGLQGGQPGAVHHYTIEQGGETVTLGSKDANATLMPGAVLTLRSAGGGGFGDPRLREPSLVKRDLDYGYVTG